MDITVNSQSNTVAPKQAECKKMRYSIRKVATVGATSALVGTLAFLGATQVKADQVTETAPAVATATATPETSTASLTVASETATSVATSEAVESSVAHSEVATTPVTETQPSNTTPSVVEEKASSTVVTSSSDATTPSSTVAAVSAPAHTSEAAVEAPTSTASSETADTHTEVALKPTENSAANANLSKLNGRIKSIVEDNMTSDQIVALTEEEIKALNKVDFSDDAIKGTGTSLTYRNLKDIVASFLKQDSKLAVPYFKADTIINSYKDDSLRFIIKDDSIITFRTGDSIFTIIRADSVLPVAPKQVKHSRYDNRIHRFRSHWERIIPTHSKIQYAGNMGLLSFGTGWDYGKRNQWETDILLGFIPKYSSKKAKVTMTLKQNYMPWSINIGKGFSTEPLTCGLYVNTVFGDQFWVNEPERYPKGYYGFSSKVRFHVFMGQRLTYDIDPQRRFLAKSVTFFYEISTCDLYVISAVNNSYLRPRDYLSLSFGLKFQWL